MHKTNPSRSYQTIREMADKKRDRFNQTPMPKIHIGMATCGIASGAKETMKYFIVSFRVKSIHKMDFSNAKILAAF